MAYAGGTKAILFGGYYNGKYLNDTWEYDDFTNTWKQYNTSGVMPSGRSGHAMAFAGGNKLILFGGNLLIDTWEYDDSTAGPTAHTWTKVNNTLGTNPGFRTGYAMAYAGNISGINYIILFGGYYNGKYLNDTWEYNESVGTWKLINPTGGVMPPARSGHAMAFAGGNKLILFGGNLLIDTWEFDDSTSGPTAQTWTQRNIPLGTNPGFRTGYAMASMAYASGNNLILFGGYYNGNYLNDAWEYNDSVYTWTLINPTGGVMPPARSGHAMAYAGNILGHNHIILFGGNLLDDTWDYDDTTQIWAQHNTAVY